MRRIINSTYVTLDGVIQNPQDWPSPGQYIDLRTENHSFQEISISQGRSGTLLGRF